MQCWSSSYLVSWDTVWFLQLFKGSTRLCDLPKVTLAVLDLGGQVEARSGDELFVCERETTGNQYAVNMAVSVGSGGHPTH